jgi:hypothetical protein
MEMCMSQRQGVRSSVQCRREWVMGPNWARFTLSQHLRMLPKWRNLFVRTDIAAFVHLQWNSKSADTMHTAVECLEYREACVCKCMSNGLWHYWWNTCSATKQRVMDFWDRLQWVIRRCATTSNSQEKLQACNGNTCALPALTNLSPSHLQGILCCFLHHQ